MMMGVAAVTPVAAAVVMVGVEPTVVLRAGNVAPAATGAAAEAAVGKEA